MSLHAIGQAFSYSHAQGPAFAVLVALADWARDENNGECWPSLTTLAAKARVSRSTAIRALVELERLGEVELVAKAGVERIEGRPETACLSNTYRVTVAGAGRPVWLDR